MDQNEMSNLYRGPSIDASYQVSYHLAKRFQRKSCFRNRPIKKQELPMTAMVVNGSKQNEQFPQRTFHRCFLPRFGPFVPAVSEEKIFRNRPIRNKTVCGGLVCLWIVTKLAFFSQDLPRMLPTKFRFIWPNSFRGKEF